MIIKFCRNCGKELAVTAKICTKCGASPVNATAFCRYCGNATNAQDLSCPKCGAALSPRWIKENIVEANKQKNRVYVPKKWKVTIIVVLVSIYTLLALPPRAVIKPMSAATSDLVLEATGYTAFPLHSISSRPRILPPPPPDGPGDYFLFCVNSTQQLLVTANYIDTTSNSRAGTGRWEDVTDKALFVSNKPQVATVSSSGFVQGVSPGEATISITYTAVPGSANRTSPAEGKVSIMVACQVEVTVVLVPQDGRAYAILKNPPGSLGRI